MTTQKIHSQFDTKTNALLDQLWQEWSVAENYADRLSYENEAANDEAYRLAKHYDTALDSAKKYRQPHQITPNVYDTKITFRNVHTAQEFALAVNGQVDGRTVHTTAAVTEINQWIIDNLVPDSAILGRVSLRKLQLLGRAQ